MSLKQNFEVDLKGMSEVLYKEEDKILSLEAEPLMGESNLAVYAYSPLKWNKPFDHEIINEEKRQEILSRIKVDLGKYKIRIEVYD